MVRSAGALVGIGAVVVLVAIMNANVTVNVTRHIPKSRPFHPFRALCPSRTFLWPAARQEKGPSLRMLQAYVFLDPPGPSCTKIPPSCWPFHLCHRPCDSLHMWACFCVLNRKRVNQAKTAGSVAKRVGLMRQAACVLVVICFGYRAACYCNHSCLRSWPPLLPPKPPP